MGTVKQFLIKEFQLNKLKDIHWSICKFLLLYRTTPHCTTDVAPATLIFNRNIKTRFDLIKPNFVTEPLNRSKLVSRVKGVQNSQMKYYEGNRKEKFNLVQSVYARDYRVSKPCWVQGTIFQILGPRNYKVLITGTKMIWKRHLSQLRRGVESEMPNFKKGGKWE